MLKSIKQKNKSYKNVCKNSFNNYLKFKNTKKIETNLQKLKLYQKRHTMKTCLKSLIKIHPKFGE